MVSYNGATLGFGACEFFFVGNNRYSLSVLGAELRVLYMLCKSQAEHQVFNRHHFSSMRVQVVCTHAHTGQRQLRSPLWEPCPSPLTRFVSNLPPAHRIDFSILSARGPAFELDCKQRSTMLSVFVSVHRVKFGRPCFFALTDSDTVWMLTCLLY